MKKEKLKYQKVFSANRKNVHDKLVRKIFDFHLKLTEVLGNYAPVNWRRTYEDCKFFVSYHSKKSQVSTPIPSGYNRKENEWEEGKVELRFLDLYDFLPKENFQESKKKIFEYWKKNGRSKFGNYMSAQEFENLDRLEDFTDSESFYNIITCPIVKNQKLKKFCQQISIEIISLSPSYLIIRYRFVMTNEFNNAFKDIMRINYHGHFDTVRSSQFDWRKPWRTPYTFYEGDDERRQKVYDFINDVKWTMYDEIQKNFGCYFGNEGKFPPSFETYQTNILPQRDRNAAFWRSILIDTNFMEYSTELDMCIAWNFTSTKEPMKIQAIQGENYNPFSSVMLSEISNEYAEYLVARELNAVARDCMTKCNRDIGKELKKPKSRSILNTRLKVEKQLYYSRRFVVEFKSDLKGCRTTKRFKPACMHRGTVTIASKSFTEQAFNSLDNTSKSTMEMIDNILKHFDAMAESNNAYFSYKIAKYALVIAIITFLFELKNVGFLSMILEIIKCSFKFKSGTV